MKTRMLILAAGIFMIAINAAAEDVVDHLTVPLSNPGQPGHVKVSVLSGAIKIIGYEGSSVDVTCTSKMDEDSVQDKIREGVNGMFHIPVTSSEIEVEEDHNEVEISVPPMNNEIDLEIKVPVNTSLTVSLVQNGDVTIEHVNGEIEAENVNGGIIMTDVSGSVAASTTNGDVRIKITRVSPDKPMSFNSFNGDVDVTLPADLKASVKIKTTQGDVYSDFKITRTEKSNTVTDENKKDKEGKYRVVIERAFYGTIAGGGPEYTFTTYNGDILIRKVKQGAQ
jgi:hypothetical protein